MSATASDGAALFRAILDDPDDDLNRLAYADWLEESGAQPRGQLIRLMCWAARLAPSRNPDDQRAFGDLTAEYSVLLARHENEWLAELPSLAGINWGWAGERQKFHRGFVHAISVTDPATPLTSGRRAIEAAPIEGLFLCRPSDRQLVGWLDMKLLARLGLEGPGLDDLVADQLFHSRRLDRLKRLEISNSGLSAGSTLNLLRADWFENVERFDLFFPHNLWAMGSLPKSYPTRPRLRVLDLSRSPIAVLFLRPDFLNAFTHLERLNLMGCHLGDSTVSMLTQLRSARHWRHLDLRRNQVTGQGALALATSPLLDGLEYLDLRDNPIPPNARRRLRDRFEQDECRLLLDGEGSP